MPWVNKLKFGVISEYAIDFIQVLEKIVKIGKINPKQVLYIFLKYSLDKKPRDPTFELHVIIIYRIVEFILSKHRSPYLVSITKNRYENGPIITSKKKTKKYTYIYIFLY